MNTQSVHTNTSTYVQTNLVLLHPHQQRYLCVDGVTNCLHIMEHLAMHNKLGHSHLST